MDALPQPPEVIDLCGEDDDLDFHPYHDYLGNAFPDRDFPNVSGANHVHAAQPYIDDLHRNLIDLTGLDPPDPTPAAGPLTPGSSAPEVVMDPDVDLTDVCLSLDRPNNGRLY